MVEPRWRLFKPHIMWRHHLMTRTSNLKGSSFGRTLVMLKLSKGNTLEKLGKSGLILSSEVAYKNEFSFFVREHPLFFVIFVGEHYLRTVVAHETLTESKERAQLKWQKWSRSLTRAFNFREFYRVSWSSLRGPELVAYQGGSKKIYSCCLRPPSFTVTAILFSDLRQATLHEWKRNVRFHI